VPPRLCLLVRIKSLSWFHTHQFIRNTISPMEIPVFWSIVIFDRTWLPSTTINHRLMDRDAAMSHAKGTRRQAELRETRIGGASNGPSASKNGPQVFNREAKWIFFFQRNRELDQDMRRRLEHPSWCRARFYLVLLSPQPRAACQKPNWPLNQLWAFLPIPMMFRPTPHSRANNCQFFLS
jgi:hypothetical protein